MVSKSILRTLRKLGRKVIRVMELSPLIVFNSHEVLSIIQKRVQPRKAQKQAQ